MDWLINWKTIRNKTVRRVDFLIVLPSGSLDALDAAMFCSWTVSFADEIPFNRKQIAYMPSAYRTLWQSLIMFSPFLFVCFILLPLSCARVYFAMRCNGNGCRNLNKEIEVCDLMTWKLCLKIQIAKKWRYFACWHAVQMKHCNWVYLNVFMDTWTYEFIHVWQLKLKSVHCTNNESHFHVSYAMQSMKLNFTISCCHCNRKSKINFSINWMKLRLNCMKANFFIWFYVNIVWDAQRRNRMDFNICRGLFECLNEFLIWIEKNSLSIWRTSRDSCHWSFILDLLWATCWSRVFFHCLLLNLYSWGSQQRR